MTLSYPVKLNFHNRILQMLALWEERKSGFVYHDFTGTSNKMVASKNYFVSMFRYTHFQTNKMPLLMASAVDQNKFATMSTVDRLELELLSCRSLQCLADRTARVHWQ